MTEMLDCDAVMRRLWDYLDDELTPEREQQVSAHLALCRRCYPQLEFERAFLAKLAATRNSLLRGSQVRARVLAALRTAGFAA